MNKKKIALLLCSTGNEAFAVANITLGAKKYLFHSLTEDEYDIIFYTDKVNTKNEKALKKIHNNIKIKIYNSPLTKSSNSFELSYFSLFTFARFEAFDLLKEYKRVFYVDTDIVIQKDISSILNIDNEFAIAYFQDKMPVSKNFSEKSLKLVSGYNLEKTSAIAAVFLATDKIKSFENIKQWCYRKAEEYKTNDQSILCLALQEFNIEPFDLKESYGCFPTSNNVKDAHIIHAVGHKKFWRGTYNETWEENNKVWISLGGLSQYEEDNKKRALVNKIVWFIPFSKCRNGVRFFLLNRMGMSAR